MVIVFPLIFHKAKVLAHQLALASRPVSDEDLIMSILAGLPASEYGSLPVSLDELFGLLLTHEVEINA
jgi:hypothetical protein